MLRAWTDTWRARAYLDFYRPDFKTPPGQSHKAWETQRNRMLSGKQRIHVRIESRAIQAKGNEARVSFRQLYSSDNHQEASDKTLLLVNQDGSWKILEERTAP